LKTSKLRILHISDLHERAGRERSTWRRYQVLDEWKKNLDAVLQDGGIDLVCFTGDIADWGKREEYEPATAFIWELLGRLGLGIGRLFLVPGNHDIDRKQGEAAWNTLRKNLSRTDLHALSNWLKGDEAPLGFEPEHREQLLSRQAAYREWLKALGRAELLPSKPARDLLGYRHTLRREGEPDIHIISLDSAWGAGDDNDTGKLLLTDGQVGRLTADENGKPFSGFRLALVHHPLTDLVPADESICRRLLATNVDLILRGHLHNEKVETWNDPDHTARQLAAGCLYEGHHGDRWPNACHVITATLDENGRPLRYDLRLRAWSPRGGFWHDDSSLYRGAEGGRLTWDFSRGSGPEPASKKTFVGRISELDRLAKSLLPDERKPVALCAINGMAGVGKTFLAEHFYTVNKARFPGGLVQLALNPSEPQGADMLLGLVADRLGMSGAGDALRTRARQRFLRPLTLLLVENVDTKECADAVAQLAQHLAGCPILVTGRFRAFGSGGWEVVNVQSFDEATALAQLAQEWKVPRDQCERAAHELLVRALGGLPLAIHLAAGYLGQGYDVASFLSELRKKGFNLEPVHIDDPLLRDKSRAILRATFELSLKLLAQQLGEDASHLIEGLVALGHAPASGVGQSLGASVAGLSLPDFQRLMFHALRVSLVDRVPESERRDDAWRIHPLIAEFLRDPRDAEKVLARVTAWFFERLPEREDVLAEKLGRQWGEVNQERDALVSWLAQVPQSEAARVEHAGTSYAIRNGPFTAWMGFCERALETARSPNERFNLLWTLANVAKRGGRSNASSSPHKRKRTSTNAAPM